MDIQQIEAEIEPRIATHRQGDFQLRLRDAAGAPVARAQVTLRLVRHDFRLGANGFLLRGGSRANAATSQQLTVAYEQAFAGWLNYATLPFYWGGYEPAEGQESSARLRDMATWCRDHNVRTKGHPLAWHEVFPEWAKAHDDTTVLARLRDRISRLVNEFRGLIDTWDVFNETTVATNFDNAVGRWVKARGAVDCVAECLQLARDANPHAELLYNDFNVSPAFEQLVEALQQRGAPMDAIGIQSHQHVGAWTAEKIWQTCETYARFRLPLHFTEATLLSGRLKPADDRDWHRRHLDWTSTPEGEARQLAEGQRFYSLLFSHPAVNAITWWDFSDRRAWQGAPAGLLRDDMSPKPLADWLRHAFTEHWTTRVTVPTDDQGTARFRGFYGAYTLRAVTEHGGSLAGECHLARHGVSETDVLVD